MVLTFKKHGFVGGFKNLTGYDKSLGAVLPLVVTIEFFSNVLVRPFTHAVRLFANMFAGHLLLLIFFSGALYMWSVGGLQYAFGTLAFLIGVLLTFFELLVIALQAYIFVTLTAVYVSESLAEEH
jgi:F-type H+-transporting ATPase subunit a